MTEQKTARVTTTQSAATPGAPPIEQTTTIEATGESMSQSPTDLYPNTGEIEGTFTPAAWNFLRSAAAARAQTALNEAHTIAQTPTSFLNPNIEFDAQSIDILQTIGTQADFLQGKISELLNEPFVSALHKPWPAEVHGQLRKDIGVRGAAEESRPPSAKPK